MKLTVGEGEGFDIDTRKASKRKGKSAGGHTKKAMEEIIANRIGRGKGKRGDNYGVCEATRNAIDKKCRDKGHFVLYTPPYFPELHERHHVLWVWWPAAAVFFSAAPRAQRRVWVARSRRGTAGGKHTLWRTRT